MNITNQNLRKPFFAVFIALFAISIMDFTLARISGSINEWFWGYMFIVNIFLIAMVYFLFGKPIFKYDDAGEMVEIIQTAPLFGSFEERLSVNRANLVDFQIVRNGIRTKLIIKILQQNGVISRRFNISFLSKRKREALEKRLAELVPTESNDVHMFI